MAQIFLFRPRLGQPNLGIGQRLGGGGSGGPRLARLSQKFARLGKDIEQLPVPPRIEKAAVVVLAVEFDKSLGQGPQNLARHPPIVNPRRLAAVGGVDASEDQLTVLGLDPCLGQDLVHRMAGLELENRRNLALLGPCPHQLGPPAPAKDKAQCVKKDGFAGARLAGQHIQARLKLESKPIDDQHIADIEAPEHGSPKAWRGACLHHSHSPLTICR